MKLRFLGTGVLLLAASVDAETRKVTVDDLMKLRTIADVRISPDGRDIAYVVSQPSYELDAHDAVLYRIPASGGSPIRLTFKTRIFNRPVPNPRLRWSPDGTLLSFVAFVDEVPQVVAMGASGGEPRPVTAVKDGVTTYEWSPDGKRIAFVAPDPAPEEEERRKKEKSFVIEVDRGDRPPRLFVQEAEGGAAKALSPPGETVSSFDWSPDGKTLAYSSSTEKGFNAQYHGRIYTVPAEGGERFAVVDRDGMNAEPRYSPDGRIIAFISTGGRAAMIATVGLWVAPSAGGPARSLTESWVGEYAWAADGRSLFYIANEGTGQRREHMFEQPIQRVNLETGASEVVTPEPMVNYSLSLSRDGKRLAYRSVEAETMGDIVVQDLPGGRPTRITSVNPELEELEFGNLEPTHWRSFDGMEIWGLLLTPPGYAPGRRIPLLVYVHGGPIGGVTYGIFPQFMHRPGQVDPYPVQAMASAGFAVLFPMPRGGSGYGLEGFRAIVGSWGQGDFKDIMAGVDEMIARGIADPERLGVMGGSYGGFMTNWIVTQTGRFKAASSMCSISDIEDLYYLSDAGDVTIEYFGEPWEKPDSYAAHSPITHVAKVTTPLLIQHGENDRRVPIMQAQKFYKALKKLGKTVEMEIYPRGGHVLYEPDLEREIMRRNLAWFERWLAP
jgi:dipeptidyl aminopeptidase/acylaminoacyl peptidase